MVGMLTTPPLTHRTSFNSIGAILNDFGHNFYKTYQFLRKFISLTIILTAIIYPKIKSLSLLFAEILAINCFIL